jgi:hypothetical protein
LKRARSNRTTCAEAEVHREICPGHVLFGRSVTAFGYRQDCDDVLFYLGKSAPGFAVAHLTYQRENEFVADLCLCGRG